MAKRNIKQGKYDKLKAMVVKIVAAKRGVSEDYVYKVLRGERKGNAILEEYSIAREKLANAVKNLQPVA